MVNYDTRGCKTERIYIARPDGSQMRVLVVRADTSEQATPSAPGVLWLHGGGYMMGFPEMVFMSRAADLVRECGAVVVSPAYRLSVQKPYPAALEDSALALRYMRDNAAALGIRPDQLMVGGESAGGGLAAALCLYARDHGTAKIAFQMPLYPMLDCEDTPSSANNHAKVWNTRRNHAAWKRYLRGTPREAVPPYASPSRAASYAALPPAYTYVGDAEPFYCETLTYIKKLQKAGVPARVDVYPGGYHAFDMMEPDSAMAKRARERFCATFNEAKTQYFAAQEDECHA